MGDNVIFPLWASAASLIQCEGQFGLEDVQSPSWLCHFVLSCGIWVHMAADVLSPVTSSQSREDEAEICLGISSYNGCIHLYFVAFWPLEIGRVRVCVTVCV